MLKKAKISEALGKKPFFSFFSGFFSGKKTDLATLKKSTREQSEWPNLFFHNPGYPHNVEIGYVNMPVE